MPEVSSTGSVAVLFFLSNQFISALSDDTPSLKNTTGDNHTSSHLGTGTEVLIICLAVVVILLFSLFLFKLYQKKKREEQYARLLKLFEEDDELEVELGLRD
ncbi:hypothetical protein Droror1_Dr00021660 [Drosera rotundifolia]